MYDEPFADSSQIPTSIISNYSKKYAGVILSGDGGDELFGGYTRYLEADKFLNNKIDFKTFLKLKFGKILKDLNPNLIRAVELVFNQKNLKSRSENFLNFQNSKYKNYSDFLCQIKKLDDILIDKFINKNYIQNDKYEFIENNFEKFMAQDLNEYLPNDILTKVDRASMRYGLEVRVPLLDFRIVKFALSLNIENKISGNNQKKILKKVLEKNIPKELIKNKKVGFGIPIDAWIRTHLKDRAKHLLSEECMKDNPYLNKEGIQNLWDQHQKKIGNHGLKLWNIIIFQNWYIKNKKYLNLEK